MLHTATIDKLTELNLTGMAAAFTDQLEHPAPYAELDFPSRLGLLADREATERDNRSLERNLKAAKLRQTVAVEEFDFAASRGRDRTQLLHLAEAGWVAEHRDLIVVGPTGAGKTFLACALAHAACRRGYRALYLCLPRALDELTLARVDGRLTRLLAAYSRVDVLVCDDLALRPLPAEQAADLLEIIDDRHRRRSTIVTSQLPVADWHTALGERPSPTFSWGELGRPRLPPMAGWLLCWDVLLGSTVTPVTYVARPWSSGHSARCHGWTAARGGPSSTTTTSNMLGRPST